MMKSAKELKFAVGVEQKALVNGVQIPLYINFLKVPHLLIVAPSGSGKTYLLVLILKQLAQMPISLVLADFKGVDFISLDGCKNYYKHQSVEKALSMVFEELQERMANPRFDFKPIVLLIDEWSGFLGILDKKTQEHYKQMLASILMLGRGLQIFVIVALQRADASYITGRDNIGNCIGLGRLSEESIRMTFTEYKDDIVPKTRGKGYLRIDGKQLQELVVPIIRDYDGAMETIRSALQ